MPLHGPAWSSTAGAGGGTLDRQEVFNLAKEMGQELTEKELDKAMAEMDADGSGAVPLPRIRGCGRGRGANSCSQQRS